MPPFIPPVNGEDFPADMLKAKSEDMMNRFRLNVHRNPGDAAVQSLVDEYVAFALGSVSEDGIQRTMEIFSQPLFHRLFQMADMTDPDAQSEAVYQLILEAMKFRLEHLSAEARVVKDDNSG